MPNCDVVAVAIARDQHGKMQCGACGETARMFNVFGPFCDFHHMKTEDRTGSLARMKAIRDEWSSGKTKHVEL